MRILCVLMALALLACGDSDGGSDGHGGDGVAGGGDGDGDGDGDGAACEIPTGAGDLMPWLETSNYESWPSESAMHDSAGPHFGAVRVYLNDELNDSLEAGNDEHPKCSASVKELYGDEGTEVKGFSVMVKLADDSDGGDNWYWYEFFDGNTLVDDQGASACIGCHGGGTDFSLSAFPLE